MLLIGGGTLLAIVRGRNRPIASAASTHNPRITKSESLGFCRNRACRMTEILFAAGPVTFLTAFGRARMAREIGMTLLA